MAVSQLPDICRVYNRQVPGNLFNAPVPPGNLEQLRNFTFRKTHFNNLRWVACYNGVVRHIFGHNGLSCHDGTIPDFHTRHDHSFITDPDIVSYYRISFVGVFRRGACSAISCFPAIPEDSKRESGDWPGFVIATIHDKFYTGGNGTELPDPKLIPYEVEMIEYVSFEIMRIIQIMIIGIISDYDIRILDDVLQKNQIMVMRKRVCVIRIRR